MRKWAEVPPGACSAIDTGEERCLPGSALRKPLHAECGVDGAKHMRRLIYRRSACSPPGMLRQVSPVRTQRSHWICRHVGSEPDAVDK